eukprot:589182-Prymnesium_polylepis.1
MAGESLLLPGPPIGRRPPRPRGRQELAWFVGQRRPSARRQPRLWCATLPALFLKHERLVLYPGSAPSRFSLRCTLHVADGRCCRQR